MHLIFRQNLLFGFLEMHTHPSWPLVCCSLNHRTHGRLTFPSAPKLLAVPVFFFFTYLHITCNLPEDEEIVFSISASFTNDFLKIFKVLWTELHPPKIQI